MIYTCKHCGMPNDLKKRSNNQNAYLHLVFGKIAEHTGYTTEEVKCLMKIEFGYYEKCVNKRTGEEIIIYKETSKMSSTELSKFTELVLLFANSKMHLNILTPEEYFTT